MAQWDGMEITGALADVIDSITDEEKAFYDYIDDLSDKIFNAMENRGWTKADLARATGKSRAWVTQVLSGESNMTMKTFISILYSMDLKARTEIVSKDVCSWKEAADNFEYLNLKTNYQPLQRLHAAEIPVGRGRGKLLKFADAA